MGRRDQDNAEPWAFQSKEFMRGLVIGKTVQVTVEYTRTQSPNETTGETYPERVYATVHLMNKSKRNVAEALIGEGLATTLQHRQGDERSSEYDKLLLAEANAKKRGKNKKKGLEDNVVDGGTMGGDDFQPTKKRRRNKDKDKNKQDDLAEGTITGTGPVKSKKRKNKKTEDGDPTTTVNQQTDFGTTNPATTKGSGPARRPL